MTYPETLIQLSIDGRVFEGWESFGYTSTLDALNIEASFEFYNPSGSIEEAAEGEKLCVVKAFTKDGALEASILVGYITALEEIDTVGGQRTRITIKDRTFDLVRCSAIHKSGQWVKARYSKIVSDLIKPFDIAVDFSGLASDELVERFALDSGENVFPAIERLSKMFAVLPIATPDGGLRLTQGGPEGAASEPLVLGRNIKTLKRSRDFASVYSNYIGLAQTTPKLGDPWASSGLGVLAEVSDPDVQRYSPRVFVAERKADRRVLAKRVAWEQQVRRGRSQQIEAPVASLWQRDAQGKPTKLWQKNETVRVVNEKRGIDLDLVVSALRYSKGVGPDTVALQLRDPKTFKTEA